MTPRRSKAVAIFALLVGLLAAPYLLLDTEKAVMDENARSAAPGSFVRLPQGWVHYELAGTADAPTVVLVHGFSVPYYVWDTTFAALTTSGLRVLRYDLYGRGYSDRPDSAYNLPFYVEQLAGLLDALGIRQPVHLVGLSMGAPIAAAFANRHTQQVRSLTFIAPEVASVTCADIFPMNVPLLGEYFMGVYVAPVLLPSSQVKDFYRPENFPDWENRYRVQMRYKGTRRALLATIRSLAHTDTLAEYRAIGQRQTAVLLLWGRRDQTVSQADIQALQQAMPGARFYPISATGHLPHYERPQIVNPLLLEFLQAQ